jgi:hypothetical protein
MPTLYSRDALEEIPPRGAHRRPSRGWDPKTQSAPLVARVMQSRRTHGWPSGLVLSCLIRATGWANAPRWGGRLRCWLATPLPLPQQWTCSAMQIATRVPLLLYLGPRLVNVVSLAYKILTANHVLIMQWTLHRKSSPKQGPQSLPRPSPRVYTGCSRPLTAPPPPPVPLATATARKAHGGSGAAFTRWFRG